MQADSAKINNLLKTARGQLEGILKMVEQDQYCLDISHQLLACEAILKKANREILQKHLECCVRDAFASGSPEEAKQKIEELISLMQRLTK